MTTLLIRERREIRPAFRVFVAIGFPAKISETFVSNVGQQEGMMNETTTNAIIDVHDCYCQSR